MYLLYREGGYHAQELLWQLRRKGVVVVHELTSAEADRMDVLMQQYKDTPMDLADASLVAVAASRNQPPTAVTTPPRPPSEAKGIQGERVPACGRWGVRA